MLKSILHKPHSALENPMNEQTKIELLKIAATLTTAKFKDGDDLELVFTDCFALAERCLRQRGKTEPTQHEQTLISPHTETLIADANLKFADID